MPALAIHPREFDQVQEKILEAYKNPWNSVPGLVQGPLSTRLLLAHKSPALLQTQVHVYTACLLPPGTPAQPGWLRSYQGSRARGGNAGPELQGLGAADPTGDLPPRTAGNSLAWVQGEAPRPQRACRGRRPRRARGSREVRLPGDHRRRQRRGHVRVMAAGEPGHPQPGALAAARGRRGSRSAYSRRLQLGTSGKSFLRGSSRMSPETPSGGRPTQAAEGQEQERELELWARGTPRIPVRSASPGTRSPSPAPRSPATWCPASNAHLGLFPIRASKRCPRPGRPAPARPPARSGHHRGSSLT